MSAEQRRKKRKNTTRKLQMAGLAPWTYADAELLELEYQRLILGTWQTVGHQNDVPDPGDYLTFDFMRDSVVVVRGADHRLRAFKNVCRHRASRLLDGEGSCPKRIVCPYHNWTYGLDGALLGVPSPETFPGLDKADYGLTEVELEVFLGMIFVRVAGEGPSVAASWADYAPMLAPYDIPAMERVFDTWVGRWDVNWKVAVDNNMDNYHVPMSHPGYHRLLDNDLGGFGNRHGVSGSISTLRERLSTNWVERMYQQLAPKVLADRPAAVRTRFMFFAALPNLALNFYPDSIDFFHMLPLGPTECEIRWTMYGLPDDRREMKVLRYLNQRINRQVGIEDEDLCLRVQEGLGTGGYEPGPLSVWEAGVREFHDEVRRVCPVATLDQAPAPGTVAQVDEDLRAA